MKTTGFISLFLGLALSGTMLVQIQGPIGNKAVRAEGNSAATKRVLESYGKLPLYFIENRGQFNPDVDFALRGEAYKLFLSSTEAVLPLPGRREKTNGNPPDGKPSSALRMKLVDANPQSQGAGVEEFSGKSNYFIGNDPARWQTNVHNYAKVRYEEVYPGIDLIYYGKQRQLEYDFVVAPGADPEAIGIAFEGADKVELGEQGDLVLQAEGEEIRLRKPVIYQEMDTVRNEVEGKYVLQGDRVGFEVASYDARRPLVIDPVLVYSSYLGGGSGDTGYEIELDSAGNIYVTGVTASDNFPTGGSPSDVALDGDNDIFVTKLDRTGSVLVYSTYIGGGSAEQGFGIAVDPSGNAYVTGATSSVDFPATAGAFDESANGGVDAFVLKLNGTGSELVYATYLGGTQNEMVSPPYNSIAVNASGNAYVTGDTTSTDFPVSSGGFRRTHGGGARDAYVVKLNPNGSARVYGTYLGGSGEEDGRSIAVDGLGNAYVTGFTTSTDFPTERAVQPTYGGGPPPPNVFGDAFITKLNAEGSELFYSTYLGGTTEELAWRIAVDPSGNAYVVGRTASTNFPTVNPLQETYGGGALDAFVVKVNASGESFDYVTYLGGAETEQALGVAVDPSGNVYATGSTNSPDFPTETPFQKEIGGGGDAFIVKITDPKNNITFSTGEFEDSEWSANISGTGSSTASTVASGGNPGSYRKVSLTVGPNQNVRNCQIWNLAAFTPATQGPVTSVSVAYDLTRISSTVPSASQVAKEIAVQQGGVVHRSAQGVTTVSPPTWEQFSIADIVPLFPEVGWAEGSEIRFGFCNTVSTSSVGFTIDGGYDNFRVIINHTPLAGAKPVLPPNSMVNGASFRAATQPGGAVAPGAIVSVFGTDLATDIGVAEGVPLPSTLLDTKVSLNGTDAPLFTVSGTQINAQVPFELQPGQVSVQVTRAGEPSEAQTVTVASVSPGIFAVNQQGTGQGAILIANSAILAAPSGSVPGREARPASRLEFISIFCTGLGDVTNRPPSGEPPSGGELSVTVETPTVTIGGVEAQVSFSGLSGFVGLYQVNVQVPSEAPTGEAVELVLAIGGVSSNTVTIAIQ